MPSCCILQCGARKSKNHPQLTLHRFPTKDYMKKKWLDSIGIENINNRHKMWYVCSLHFDETCFNRTLDLIRLHDGAVPSSFKVSRDKASKPVLLVEQNKQDSTYLAESPDYVMSNKDAQFEKIRDKVSRPVLSEIQNKQDSTCLVESSDQVTSNKDAHLEKIQQQTKEIKKMAQEREVLKREIKKMAQEREVLKKEIRRLQERVRRRNKKIALFSNINKDLRSRNFVNNEQSVILEECAGPEGFLKRQIAKAKGLPVEKKYSEEIRRFALTLHFFSPKAYNFIRRTYNTCLPHSRTLSKWYQCVDAEPGFTKEAFDALRRKIIESGEPLICALTLDEMAIRKCQH